MPSLRHAALDLLPAFALNYQPRPFWNCIARLKPKPKYVELSLTPADNRRLASLCGSHDEHLKQIEEYLGVEIANRGNLFRVSGGP